jgi:hypothetical protein
MSVKSGPRVSVHRWVIDVLNSSLGPVSLMAPFSQGRRAFSSWVVPARPMKWGSGKGDSGGF